MNNFLVAELNRVKKELAGLRDAILHDQPVTRDGRVIEPLMALWVWPDKHRGKPIRGVCSEMECGGTSLKLAIPNAETFQLTDPLEYWVLPSSECFVDYEEAAKYGAVMNWGAANKEK